MNQKSAMNMAFTAVDCPADTACKIGGDFWGIPPPLPGDYMGVMLKPPLMPSSARLMTVSRFSRTNSRGLFLKSSVSE